MPSYTGSVATLFLVLLSLIHISLDELPPIVIVVKDPETGLYHVLKTAMASDAGNETTYKVSKNHLFGVGDFVTIGGALTGASDKITAIDKSNAEFDTITLEATIGAAAKGQVSVSYTHLDVYKRQKRKTHGCNSLLPRPRSLY